MEAVFKYLKTYVGRFGMGNLVLLGLEDILDDNFVCPCKHDYNHAISFFYAFVPALGCLICTMLFVDLSVQGVKEGKRYRCTKQRVSYSLLSVSICVSLYFIDGRYVACAYSDWEGVYTKSNTLGIGKWCKPVGNETSELKSELRTLELMFISQLTGFILMILVIVIFAIVKYYQANTGADGQEEALIWLFLFLFDGRYIACARSHWGGQYTDTGTMKWCKPTGNETLMFESQLETQMFITISQIFGFLIFGVIIGIVGSGK
ncbi:protein FAM26F-like, partial [Clarias magur]